MFMNSYTPEMSIALSERNIVRNGLNPKWEVNGVPMLQQ